MKRVSLHLRITTNLYDTLISILNLDRSFMQCFLLSHPAQQHLVITKNEQHAILSLISKHNLKIYIHAPYWINLCSEDIFRTQHMLKAEIKKASTLGVYAYVMHLGHDDVHPPDLLLQRIIDHLEYVVTTFPTMQFIVENSHDSSANQGVTLYDFSLLFAWFSGCNNISFCLDTAHIYSAGYDITQRSEHDRLMQELEHYIGYERISLIHCNDTLQPIGSSQDIHYLPGKGLIGKEPLQRLINEPALKKALVILELPNSPMDEQLKVLEHVDSWIKQD